MDVRQRGQVNVLLLLLVKWRIINRLCYALSYGSSIVKTVPMAVRDCLCKQVFTSRQSPRLYPLRCSFAFNYCTGSSWQRHMLHLWSYQWEVPLLCLVPCTMFFAKSKLVWNCFANSCRLKWTGECGSRCNESFGDLVSHSQKRQAHYGAESRNRLTNEI